MIPWKKMYGVAGVGPFDEIWGHIDSPYSYVKTNTLGLGWTTSCKVQSGGRLKTLFMSPSLPTEAEAEQQLEDFRRSLLRA